VVSGGLEPLTTGFKGGGRIRGKFTNQGEEEEFVIRNRCTITRCTCGCGKKSKFGASSKWNKPPTTE